MNRVRVRLLKDHYLNGTLRKRRSVVAIDERAVPTLVRLGVTDGVQNNQTAPPAARKQHRR